MVDFYQIISKGLRPTGGFVLWLCFGLSFQNQGQMVDFYQTVSKGLRPTGGFVLLKQFDKNRNKDKKAKLAMYEIQK